MSLIGQTLGQYRVVEFIGAGGMASVYKAYQASLDRYVAIKVLPAQHALTSGFKDRFILEAKAVAQLSHPNILPIYDFGLEGDLSYFVMKYVPDHTLSELLGKPMELARVSHFIDQVAGALDHAHAKGIVHRDVKPANMLLEGDWLLLTDFGLAKITEASTVITSTGHIFGTPAYVSPEQAEGNPLDYRTDIYSLGIVLYQMVVGRVPYEGTTAMRIINKHIHEPPPLPCSLRPGLPKTVEQVILKALAKRPVDRYQHAGDLAKALRKAGETASVQPAPVPPASARPKRRTGKRTDVASPPNDPQAAAQPAVVTKLLPPSEIAVSPEPPPAPLPGPRRSVSGLGMGLVGAALLLFIVGVFIFFANGGDAAGSATATPYPTTPAMVSANGAETRSPTATPVPATPASLISGTLAIPVKLGLEFKVYVTGFDGAGINGSTPVSMGNVRQPMFRRDGQAIVVNGTSTGALRGIFVTDGQGFGPNPLNDRGDAYWPVWSPDGAEIMFIDLDRGRSIFRQNSQVARAEADYRPVQANNATLVGNNLVWSDDNQLIFQGCADWAGQAGRCGIWITDANAIDPVRLTSDAGLPTDARNGQLTYMLAEDGDWEIYLVPLAGGQSINLTNNTSQDGLAAIAPDGRSVAYVSNESGNWAVWTITLSNNQKQKWFELDPQRGAIDVNTWAEERMSWTP